MKMKGIMNEVVRVFWALSLKYPECFCALGRGKNYASISLFLNDSDHETIDVEQYIDALRVGGSKEWVNDDEESHLRVLHIEWEAIED